MTAFTLETSGYVAIPVGSDERLATYTFWPDLSPFVQGYVEALFASLATPPFTEHPHLQREGVCYGETIVGFSDLSPEALALILRDCEAARDDLNADDTARDGKTFWRSRQLGFCDDFPPQTPYLADDGKVHLRNTE